MGRDFPSGPDVVFGMSDFAEMPLSRWSSVVVPVVVVGTAEVRCVGTAFNIAPDGMWVTARHVIEEALNIANSFEGGYVAILWTGSGEDCDVPDLLGGFIPVPIAGVAGDADLGLLRAGMIVDDQAYRFPVMPLSARFPRNGTKIGGVGYARFVVDSDVETADARTLAIQPNFRFTSGEITQVFPTGRDSVMLPTACFETSARFDAGMSGGPLFGVDGHVCGVIASSFNDDRPTGPFTSYASAAPLIFTLSLNFEDGVSMSVYEMAQNRMVVTDQYFEVLECAQVGDALNVSFFVENSS